jgi:predicted porin
MRRLATLGSMATTILAPSLAFAEDKGSLEVYATLLPFFESVGTQGATPLGTMTQATQVPVGLFTGINHERRFRMTSGTSNFGFRGDLPIHGDLELIWQVESPTPIDGEGPNSWASRNSHVGLTGDWGTLTFGNWDTPMKYVTSTSVNPIRGGYVADMIPIIGSPGHSTPALNPDPSLEATFEIFKNRAGFFRHETNAVQYWSPSVAGFSARVMFSANERRTFGIPGTEQGLNPYLLSGSIGYDNEWLRLRYAAELHNDYFGTANVGGSGPSLQTPSSQDVAHLALVSVKLNAGTDYETRIVVTGDLLQYGTDDVTPQGGGYMNQYSRAAFYGLIQQSFGSHNLWGAYGQSNEGECSVTGGFECTTTGLSASYFTGGYLYSFTKASGVYAIGYAVINDFSARYSPFPFIESRSAANPSLPNILEIAPGADTIGFGIGFVHSFSYKIFGDEPAALPIEPQKSQPEPVDAAQEAPDEAVDAPDEAGVSDDAKP